MEQDMRQKLFDHYERLSFSYYDQNNSGQMMSKLVSDLFDISEFAHHGPENLFISVIKIVGSFIFFVSYQLEAGGSAACDGCIYADLFLISRTVRCRRHSWTTGVRSGDVNSSLQDTLAGIRVVQSFCK